MKRRRNTRLKRLLCLCLALILLVGTLPSTALANNGTEDSDAAETSAGDIATDMDAEEEAADSTDDASDSGAEAADTDADTAETGLPEGWSPGGGARTAGTGTADDVTSSIKFENGELSTSSGTVSEGSGITFTYTTYTFSIDWSVDFTSLGGDTLIAGDYFTFKVPAGLFGNDVTLDIKNSSGTVMATLTIDANGNGKVTFNNNVETLTNVSGDIELSAGYKEYTAGKEVNWSFEFGGESYKYSGTSAGYVTPAGTITDDVRKNGWQATAYKDTMGWISRINMQEEAWMGDVTVKDTLGSDQKMTTIIGSANSVYGYYGEDNCGTENYYGTSDSNMSNYYFAIAVVDWESMRNDYNQLIAWNIANNYTSISYYTGGTDPYDTSGTLITSMYATPTSSLSSGISAFMNSVMCEWVYGGNYLYMTPYTGGLKSVTVTDGGYTIVFPGDELNETSLYIRYFTKLTSPISPDTVWNKVEVSGTDIEGEDEATASISVKASITGTKGEILLYKYNANGTTPLSDVSFTLTEANVSYNSTESTSATGIVKFALVSNGSNGYAGTYTLKEDAAPSGYTLMDDIILTLNSDGEITAVNGTPISGGSNTIITDTNGNRICQISADQLALIVYNQEESTTTRTVMKVWEDNDNQSGARPTSIDVQLYANGTAEGNPVTLDAANDWSYTWSNLPEKQGGSVIDYIVKEVNVPAGYEASYDEETEGLTTITNYYLTVNAINGIVGKVWDDNDDQDGIRPTSIQVQLYADGIAVGDPVTLNEANSWSYEFEDLPEVNNGVEIVYEVKEVDIPSGYTVSYSSVASGFTITNSHTPETVDVSGTKTWDDNDDQDGKRPTSITVNLLADNAVIDSKTVTASDNWAYEWTGLPKYAAGVEITYTVSEDPVSDYATVVNVYDITNSYTPGETSRTVTKVWDDNNNQDGNRPASIQVQLYANEAVEGSAVTLDAANGWSYTWSNLPEMKNGTAVVYTVEETGVPTDYTAAYSTDGFTITNSYTPETVEKTVMKVWSDNNDQDGLRTDEITVQLNKDGDICGSAVILNEANNWSCTWSSLDKYDAGAEIEYEVKEINVPDGYTASYSTDTFTITNTHTTAATERTVTKVWDDANNQDGLRPDSITVHLKADGVLYMIPLPLMRVTAGPINGQIYR